MRRRRRRLGTDRPWLWGGRGAQRRTEQALTGDPTLQSDKPPPKSAIPEIQAKYDQFVAEPLRNYERNAPEEIANESRAVAAGVKKIRNGGFTAVLSPAFRVPASRAGAYFYDNCDDQKSDVKATDYAFAGLKSSYSPGLTRFKLDNKGKEVHHMIIFKRKAGVTESFDQILKLRSFDSKMDSVTGADDADPGTASYTSANLTSGQYLAVCFLPKGAVPGKEGKGPPHFVLGMKKEFEVQ